MATTTNVTTTYAGEFAGKYIAAALLSANTLASGVIDLRPNVKYKEVVKRLDIGSLTADASCDFTPTSSVSLTERILQPKELQVNLELCKSDFVPDWEAVQMGYSAFDELPKNFADFLIAQIVAKIAQKTEQDIWNGTVGAGTFDGFITLLMGDTGHTGNVKISGSTITAANVVSEIGEVVDAIPAELYGREDLYIYVSQNVARAYVRALGGFGANGLGANGKDGKGTTWYNGGDLNFDGVKIFVANGLPSNTMLATTKDNLVFGTGLMSDHNEVKIIDMADIDGSKNVRFIMRYTAGVQYGIVEDIVSYKVYA
jgi:hypothetical protein